MKLRVLGWFWVVACFFSSCEKPATRVEVTETRGLTSKDKGLRLDASADERFRDAKPSPVDGPVPDGWLKRPSTQMRLLNYRFGVDGEVWVSLSQGSILENVNRWLKQFSVAEISASGLDALKSVSLGKNQGVWVEASGDYNAGMMAGGLKKNRAMAGVIGKTSQGQILTVKMIGAPEEVAIEKAKLEEFCRTLTER